MRDAKQLPNIIDLAQNKAKYVKYFTLLCHIYQKYFLYIDI